jgi:hypothetical protein
MRRQRDPDLLLVEEMLAPPPLDQARSSLEYWQRRRTALPVYRRGARREAKEMATRWRERVHAAERARFESTFLGRLLAPLGVSYLRVTKRGLVALAWMFVPRQVRLVVIGVAAAWLIAAAAIGTVLVVALSSALS